MTNPERPPATWPNGALIIYCDVDMMEHLTPGRHLKVFDLDSGKLLDQVVACNVREGWVIEHVTDKDGNVLDDGQQTLKLKRHGRFTLHWNE